MSLQIIEESEGLNIFAIEGRLDADSVSIIQPEILRALAARKAGTIIDMSKVTFMASLGIRMMVESAKTLAVAGHKLVLLNPSDLVERTLNSSGFGKVIKIEKDEAQARQIAKKA